MGRRNGPKASDAVGWFALYVAALCAGFGGLGCDRAQPVGDEREEVSVFLYWEDVRVPEEGERYYGVAIPFRPWAAETFSRTVNGVERLGCRYYHGTRHPRGEERGDPFLEISCARIRGDRKALDVQVRSTVPLCFTVEDSAPSCVLMDMNTQTPVHNPHLPSGRYHLRVIESND